MRGVLPLDWDRKKRVTPAGTASQETWPEVEKPRPRNLGQSRGGAPRGERVPQDARLSPEARTGGNACWRGEAPRDSCAYRRSASLHFFEATEFVALVGKPRARERCENESARHLLARAASGSLSPHAGRGSSERHGGGRKGGINHPLSGGYARSAYYIRPTCGSLLGPANAQLTPNRRAGRLCAASAKGHPALCRQNRTSGHRSGSAGQTTRA